MPLGRYTCFVMPVFLMACSQSGLAPPGEVQPDVEARAVVSPQITVAPRLNLAQAAIGANRTFLSQLDTLYSSDATVQAQLARTAALDAQARSAANPFRPDVSLSAQTFGDEPARLVLSQTLCDFGQRGAEVDRIAAEQGMSVEALADVQTVLLTEALEAVATATDARARISLHQRQIAGFTEAKSAAQNLLDLNLGTAVDVRLAEVRRQDAQIDLERARRDLADAELVWSRLFGASTIPSGIDMRALRSVSGVASSSDAKAAAYETSLGLRRLRAQRVVLVADATVLQRSRLPMIRATATAGLSDDPIRGGLTFDVPLNRPKLREDIALAQANIEAIDLEIAGVAAEVNVQIDRRNALATASHALAEKRRESIDLLQQRVKDVETQVQDGLATYTDVIDARTNVFEAELEVLQSMQESRLAQIQVITATGVLVPHRP